MYVNEGTFNRLKETAANAIVERDQLKAENDRLIDACEEWIATSNRLDAENAKLRGLLQRLHKEYQYMRVRPRQMYLQHEQRMRSIEDEMRELEIEV